MVLGVWNLGIVLEVWNLGIVLQHKGLKDLCSPSHRILRSLRFVLFAPFHDVRYVIRFCCAVLVKYDGQPREVLYAAHIGHWLLVLYALLFVLQCCDLSVTQKLGFSINVKCLG